MDVSDREWEVRRHGEIVRVDVASAALLTERDTQDIIAATNDLLDDDGVSVVRLDGVSADEMPPRAFVRTLKALRLLAERRGKQFILGLI